LRNKHGLNVPEGKITFDFSRIKRPPFDIKSESSYIANLSNGSIELKLKKKNYIAWVDMPKQEFQDHIIEAKIRLDSFGGYAAAGIIFHIMDETSYYLALVSSKGYCRVDEVKDSVPRPLIAWTEISDFNGTNIDLKIITYEARLVFLVNGKWLGEADGDAAGYGRLGFALASYIQNDDTEHEEEFTCAANLDFLSIDTRTKSIDEQYKKCTDKSIINAEERLRLVETFAVMGEAEKALDQLNKAWKRRDEAISSVATTYTEVRTRKELLIAARLSISLGEYNEAERFINSLLDQNPELATGYADSAEGILAYTEKLIILNELKRFEELKEFVSTHYEKINKDINFYTLTARCYWELKEFLASAESWDRAFQMNHENGVYAANAANAYEAAGKKREALKSFICAGKIFLNQGNNAELEAIMPGLLKLGVKNWDAHILAGKWAFSIEDYDKSEEEFSIADKLRGTKKSSVKADPAAFYLWALVLNLKNKDKAAITLLEKAVELAPNYGLFRFKLEEIKIKSGIVDPNAAEEFKLALKHLGKENPNADISVREMAAYAGKLLYSAGDRQNAKYFINLANEEQ